MMGAKEIPPDALRCEALAHDVIGVGFHRCLARWTGDAVVPTPRGERRAMLCTFHRRRLGARYAVILGEAV